MEDLSRVGDIVARSLPARQGLDPLCLKIVPVSVKWLQTPVMPISCSTNT